MTQKKFNPYAILGLDKAKSPSDQEITRAYRLKALHHHPDRNPDGAETFKIVGEAYSILHDPTKKALYDQHGVIDGDSVGAASTAENSFDIAQRIADFYEAYRGSTEEKEDLTAAFATAKGNFGTIIREIALFDNGRDGEVDRIHQVLQSIIENSGQTHSTSTTRWAKTTTPEAVEKINRAMKKERKEAEQAIQEIHGDDFEGGKDHHRKSRESGGSLQALILQRQQDSFASMMSNLEAKYGSGKNSKKKEKRSVREGDDDLSSRKKKGARTL